MGLTKLKKLPSHAKSELSIIGSVLLDADTFYKVQLEPRHFFEKRNAKMWEQVIEYWSKEVNPTAETFANSLEAAGLLNRFGGYDYLAACQDEAVLPVHCAYHADQIIDAYNRRRQIEICSAAIEDAMRGDDVVDDTIAQLMRKTKDPTYKPDNIKKEWREARDGIIKTIPTPYPEMDKYTGGIRRGMVTVFTGRSKSGKSMFLAHWYNYLARQNIPIMVVPLEDKYDITLKRMAANHGHLYLRELDRGGSNYTKDGVTKWERLSDDKLNAGLSCLEHVSKHPIHWYDKKCTPAALRGVAIRYKKKFDIQAIFVDGAKDLLRPTGKYNDVGFDEEISQQLCKIAEELDVAVISIHHLTKLTDDERISVNNIRGSSNIVSDSRAVYALQSSGMERQLNEQGYDLVYCPNTGRLKNRVFECMVNNHGGTASKSLVADLECCQFKEQRKK